MVKLQAYLLLILLCPFAVLANPFLDIQIKNSDIELGKPVYIKIVAEGLDTGLSTLPLHRLSENFVLASKDLDTETVKQSNEDDKLNNNSPIRRQTLSLKLFPRQAGEFLIPVFNLDSLSTDEKLITVEDARTRGEKISFDWSLSSSEAWQREQILVSLRITTPEEYANIKLVKQSLEGIELTPLPVKREWKEGQPGGQSRITAGWSLLPIQPGNRIIDFPAVEYLLNGVVRRTFYLPKLKLSVQPLPTYLPPTIPVGEIQIETSVIPGGMLKTDELAYWNISIKSNSLPPYWLPPLLRQVKPDEHIEFYPASSKRSLQPDNLGVNGRVEHSIPFKPQRSGFICLPDLKIQYFDTATGKLETVRHHTDCAISAGAALRILTILIAAALIFYLSITLFQYFNKQIRYSEHRKSALTLIRNADSEAGLLTGLRELGRAEGWPANITLAEWLKRYQDKYEFNKKLEQLLQQLSCQYYGCLDQDNFDNRSDARLQTNQTAIVEHISTSKKNRTNVQDYEPCNLKSVIWDPDPFCSLTHIQNRLANRCQISNSLSARKYFPD